MQKLQETNNYKTTTNQVKIQDLYWEKSLGSGDSLGFHLICPEDNFTLLMMLNLCIYIIQYMAISVYSRYSHTEPSFPLPLFIYTLTVYVLYIQRSSVDRVIQSPAPLLIIYKYNDTQYTVDLFIQGFSSPAESIYTSICSDPHLIESYGAPTPPLFIQKYNDSQYRQSNTEPKLHR